MRLVAEKKTRYAQTAPTPPRLLPCIGDRGCIVGEKSGGDPCRVKIHRIKPDLRYVNGSGKVIVHPHPAPDQHQNLTTSGGLTLVVTSIVSYPAHEQNERQNEGSHYSASLDTRKQDQMSGVEMQDHLGMRRTS